MNARHLAAAFLTLAGALACVSTAHAQHDTQVVERVVAVVNDDPIFLSDIRRRAVPFLARAMQAPTQMQREEAIREIYRQVTDHLVDETLIGQAAKKAQVHVTRDDVDRALRSVMRSNHLDEARFWEAVRESGFSEATYREDVKRQITRLRLLNERLRGRVNITEDDVRAEYNRALRETRGQSTFVAADILVPVPAGATATEIAEIRHQAEALRQSIPAGGWDDAMEAHGGIELGTLHQGQLDPALEQVLLELQPGQTGAPVRNSAGFHILFLRSREAGAAEIASYEDAKAQIYQHLLERQMGHEEETFLQELRRTAVIVRHMDFSGGD